MLIRIYLLYLCGLIGPSHSVWWSLFVWRFFVGLTVFSPGSVWKEDARQSFPSLRSVHFADGEAHRLPICECPFYRECRHALKVLSRLQTGLSESRPLSSRALYRCLVRGGAASDGLIGELGVTEAEGRLLWPWAPRMRCLNNDEASLTWLVIRNALWVRKKLFAAQRVISPECGRCGDLEETISHTFFHCPVVRPLCKLLEGYMVRILNGKFLSWKPVLCAAMWCLG